MDHRLLDFKNDFMQNILIGADVKSDFIEATFAQMFARELEEAGEIDVDYQPSFWQARGLRVDGFSWEEGNNILNLFIVLFSDETDTGSLTRTEIETQFNRLTSFFKKSAQKEYFKDIEEALPVYELSYLIYRHINSFQKVKFYLLSNKIISDRVEEIPPIKKAGLEQSFHVWDISRLFRMNCSNLKKEDIIINFDEFTSEPIFCLPANLGAESFNSYLLILPGTVLAQIYGLYGSRLLEQNVRAFLQARGNVNKGLRNTILSYPQKFFAYNNGLTATAENIELLSAKGGLKLKSLKNLQIVNGGQTTASIYNAYKKDGADINKVFVQVKLTIVSKEIAEEFVPRISEYANTQNKVNAADFFSNHPYHIRIQELSRTLWAPPGEGYQKESKWFYERARGQYIDSLANKTDSEKKKFQLEYPKAKLFTKTDLSKFINVWEELPYIVSMGAQASFVEFAKNLTEMWEKDQENFNQLYYKEIIAKAIIFKSTESIITHSSWYDGGYRAQTVAYAISLLAHKIKLTNLYFNFQKVWDSQMISDPTKEQLEILTQEAYNILISPPSGVANPSQWAKRKECWNAVKGVKVTLLPLFRNELLEKVFAFEEKKSAKNEQKMNDNILDLITIYKISEESWNKIIRFGKANSMSERDESLLRTALNKKRPPSEKQAAEIMKIVSNLKKLGLEFESYY